MHRKEANIIFGQDEILDVCVSMIEKDRLGVCDSMIEKVRLGPRTGFPIMSL